MVTSTHLRNCDPTIELLSRLEQHAHHLQWKYIYNCMMNAHIHTCTHTGTFAPPHTRRTMRLSAQENLSGLAPFTVGKQSNVRTHTSTHARTHSHTHKGHMYAAHTTTHAHLHLLTALHGSAASSSPRLHQTLTNTHTSTHAPTLTNTHTTTQTHIHTHTFSPSSLHAKCSVIPFSSSAPL